MYDLAALYEANSVEEAVALRLQHPEAQIIAGGTDVLVQMREGKRAGRALISIFGIDALRGVQLEADGTIRIGSLTSFSHITKDPIIQKYINVLGQAVDLVGGPQIRNAGTIGGNTCNGVTSADSRVHPLRLGRRGGADRPKRHPPPAHPGLLPQGRRGGPKARRDPDRHPDPEGRL